MTDDNSVAADCLRTYFGYETFRGEQQAIIELVTGGGDALVLMPTGGGKSLCFQIPALLREGVGIVVSPLIALMQDQVQQLRQNGVRAAYINSSMSYAEQQATEKQALNGELDLLYMAPERIVTEPGQRLLSQIDIALFAIDEAHCVSQWGHDFRPEYTQLAQLADQFPSVPRMALTATADENTRLDIKNHLRLSAAREFISSFDRPNIQYRIDTKNNPRGQLLHFIQAEYPEATGIVYCMSRKKTEDTAQFLDKQGLTALAYHAGLSASVRSHNMRRFIVEEGIIMVATVAFGMGIDKPDVRFVAHLDMPRSIESYYQETGRAGRDGLPAVGWMVYGLQDAITFQQMLNDSEASKDVVQIERHKLTAMLGLCEATVCRRKTLLRYFGEALENDCGNCDTCLSPPATWDATDAVRKALSAVYRTGQRFGTNYLIDVLRGKSDDRISRFGHDKLAVFGIGRDIESTVWRSVFRQTIARSLLTTDMDSKGGLRLTESARPVLQGAEKVAFRVEEKPAKKKKSRASASSVSSEYSQLWEKLRETRRAIANEQGLPAYVIFHDATLMEMAEKQPVSLKAMSAISGVGAAKLEKYGTQFLSVINGASSDSTTMPDDKALEVKIREGLKLGLTGAVLAAHCGIDELTMYREMASFIRTGEVSLDQVIGEFDEVQRNEIEGEILSRLDEGEVSVKSLYDHFGGLYELDVLKLFQASVIHEIAEDET